MASVVQTLMTAEEFGRLEPRTPPVELVRGRIVPVTVPTPRHGQVCSRIDRLIGNHADEQKLGHVVVNDSGVITERDPDTVRGADVAFYSFNRVPPGPLPPGYLSVVPELVFEVRSPSERWPKVLAKAAEYLEAGVLVVCILDPTSETVQIYRPEELPRTLEGDDEFHLSDLLGDLGFPVRRFFM